jgi:hypothetical protein
MRGMAEEAIRVRNWEWPDLVRDHLISDRKWPLKKRSVIACNKARSKCSFLTSNRNDFKKIATNIACRRQCVQCALTLVLLPPFVRGITSPCFADGAHDWTSEMSGHVFGTV